MLRLILLHLFMLVMHAILYLWIVRRPQPCNLYLRPYCSIHLCRHSCRQQRSLAQTSAQFSGAEVKEVHYWDVLHSLCVCVCLHPLVFSKRLTSFHKTSYVTFEGDIRRRHLYLLAVGNTNASDARTCEVESFTSPVCVQVREVMCGLRARRKYIYMFSSCEK